MLNKYNQFILEKKVYSLILENDLKASQDFLTKLDSIRKRSKIADLLFQAFDREEYVSKDLPQNWIDVTDKDDMITFISDVKADKWLDENEDDEQTPFNMKGRTDFKIGRFVRAFFTNKDIIEDCDFNEDEIKFKDKEYEEFVNLYKSTNTKSNTRFELVGGDSIRNYYSEESHAFGERGQLGSSCMRYEQCQEYFGIYTENPKSVKLLVYLNEENKVLGRALVWKMSESPCNAEYFMDRIYTAKDSDIIKFQDYANKEGWLMKAFNSFDDHASVLLTYKNQPVVGKIVVKLKEVNFDYYPFMDTLSFLSQKSKIVSNVEFEKGMLTNWDSEGGNHTCSECDGEGKLEGKCQSCYLGTTHCQDCGGNGERRCEDCRGSGFVVGSTKTCEVCKGEGMVRKVVRRTRCQNCNGKGFNAEVCDKCNGNGLITCVTCEGDGKVDCKICSGTGDYNGPCPDCVGKYKSVLQEILTLNRFSKWKELVQKELDNLQKVKKKKKEK